MRDDVTKASGSHITPRILLDAKRVLGGLADAASQIAVGGKQDGLRPDTAVPATVAASAIRLDPARVLGGLADAATQAAAGLKPIGTKATLPGHD